MSEEERRRKAIIDAMSAVQRAGRCMTNTVLLRATTGTAPTEGHVKELIARADHFAAFCAEIEKWCAN